MWKQQNSSFQPMVEIIPSINVRTFEEVKERIAKVEPFVTWCHLDVTDGVFSKHPTWHDPRDLLLLQTKLNVEAHLMVVEPEKVLNQWLIQPVKRINVHVEAAKDIDFIIQKCREAGVEIGLAINPETFWGKLQPWRGKVDLFQVLAVTPGPSGQKMGEDTIDKIKHLRQNCPRCIIEVDGGVNKETVPLAIRAGATILVAGSYIFQSGNMAETIEILKSF